MDKLIYVAMSGAREAMRAQATTSHNLANISTTGFRALRNVLDSAPIPGAGLPTRVNTVRQPELWNSRQGQSPGHGPRPGRRDPGRGLAGGPGRGRQRRLHAQRQPAGQCQRHPGDLRGPARARQRRAGEPPALREAVHRRRRPDLDRAPGPDGGNTGAGRPAPAGEPAGRRNWSAAATASSTCATAAPPRRTPRSASPAASWNPAT